MPSKSHTMIDLRARVADLEAANGRKDVALGECQRLAIERIKTADAAVKTDIYAADALMGIAKTARAALSDAGEGKVREQAKFNFWKALRIWDMGKDYERQGCRCCTAMWKPGQPAEHTEDCCFHPAPAERPWR